MIDHSSKQEKDVLKLKRFDVLAAQEREHGVEKVVVGSKLARTRSLKGEDERSKDFFKHSKKDWCAKAYLHLELISRSFDRLIMLRRLAHKYLFSAL